MIAEKHSKTDAIIKQYWEDKKQLAQVVELIQHYGAHLQRDLPHFPNRAGMKQSVRIAGESGSGKSRVVGRGFVWQAFLHQQPVVMMDPVGPGIDNVLDKFMRVSVALPPEYRERLWQRIRYVDVGATDYVTPKPLYERRYPGETLAQAANRLLAIIKRQDANLADAPVMGWNALYEVGIYSGMIAVALSRQVDFVADLIRRPEHYQAELTQALETYPELEPAVAYFRALKDLSPEQRSRKTGSFANKLIPFLTDPIMRAIFSHAERGIDWAEVERQKLIVLLDYRHVRDPDQKQFHLLWDTLDFIEYAENRGTAGRGREIMFVIDEVTDLLGQRSGRGNSLLADDLEKLITRISRNYGINTVILHQNLTQIAEKRIHNALMQMGTQMVGQISNPDERDFLARHFITYDPHKVKKEEKVWMGISSEPFYDPVPYLFRGATFYMDHVSTRTTPTVIDTRTVEYTPQEQFLQMADTIGGLGPSQFVARAASAEGGHTGACAILKFTEFDKGQYPDETLIAPLRQALKARTGIPIEKIQEEEKTRKKLYTQQEQSGSSIENVRDMSKNGNGGNTSRKNRRKSRQKAAKLNNNEVTAHANARNNLPNNVSAVPAADQPATRVRQPARRVVEDDFWDFIEDKKGDAPNAPRS